jgi:hypothetical protein
MQQLISPKETSRLVALSSIGQAMDASLAGARVLVVENDFMVEIISVGCSMCVNGSSCEDGTVARWAAWKRPWRRFHVRCA